jgi:hypothetical protein
MTRHIPILWYVTAAAHAGLAGLWFADGDHGFAAIQALLAAGTLLTAVRVSKQVHAERSGSPT